VRSWEKGLHRTALQAILRWQTSHAALTAAAAAGLALLAIFFTVTRLEFRTSQSALISSGNRLMRRLQIADRFSAPDAFVVAIENRDTRRSLEFARALFPRLEGDHGHFAEIFSRVDPARLRPWALLYLKADELVELRESLASHESFIQGLARAPGLVTFFDAVNKEISSSMVGQVFTGFLQPENKQGTGGPADLAFLVRILEEMKGATEGSADFRSPWGSFFSNGAWEDEADQGYLWTEGKKYLLVFVAPAANSGAAGQGNALTALRQAVSAIRERFPDVQAGVTGQKALDEDEKNLAVKDMGAATLISLAGLAILLVSFWRSFRRPLLQLTTQIVGLSITFGLTTLFIGHLNLLSVTFAPIVLGLGMDYDIHWFSRYNEERRGGVISPEEALASTMEKVGPAIVHAALATGLAFFPLALAGFKGLAELGIICGIGLIVASGATLFLLPALISLFDRAKGYAPPTKAGSDIRPLLRITRRRAFVVVGLSLVATGFSLWGAKETRFDLDMLHLQSRSSESVIWETKLIEGSKYPSIYGVLFARSLGEVAEKRKALARLPTISNIQSAESFLPSHQEMKIAILRETEPLLVNIPSISRPSSPPDIGRLDDVLSRIRFKLHGTAAADWGASGAVEAQMGQAGSLIDAIRGGLRTLPRETLLPRLERFEAQVFGDLNDKLALLRESADSRPMTISDLPRPIRERFVGADDVYVMRVYPAGDVWNPRFLAAFVRDLDSVDPDATGDPVTLNVFTRQFRDSSVKAALYSLAFISAFLVLTLGSPLLALAAVVPLVIGATWTFGLMYLSGLQLNLANTMFMPLVIGAGVEYGVIIVHRWRERRKAGERVALPFSTGTGVLLAGLTTTIGFGSLMISQHRGIHSLGLLTTLGSVTVLGAGLLLLPSLLCLLPVRLRKGRRSGKDGAVRAQREREKITEEP
jgi:hopanoid biosynthesis associated RND transporter like protein HpnN